MYKWLSLLFLSSLLGCNTASKDLKDYYYPVDELNDGLVYHYKSIGDKKQYPFFWYYKSGVENGATQIFGRYYNYLGKIEQVVQEEVTEQGIITKYFKIFEQDGTGEEFALQVNIEKNQVFPFQQTKEDDINRFKINWRSELDLGANVTLNRGRIFKQWTTYNWKGKSIPCAEFLMVETIEVEENNAGVQTIETTTKELFGEGIGLIYYKKIIGEKLNMEFVLDDRTSLEELKAKFNE